MTAADPMRAASLRAAGRPVLICYLPLGDPACAAATAERYVRCGVDVVECGIPVREATLDGPTISDSMRRAVDSGVDTRRASELLAGQLEAAGGPAAVWMSYRRDPDDAYLSAVAASGAGGLLLPDADPERIPARAAAHGLLDIPFLDHDPSPAQVRQAVGAQSYVMVAAAAGVTGMRPEVGADNEELLARLRAEGVTAPLALGFGISTPEHARRAVELGADGVIVGSACVAAALRGERELTGLLDSLRGALDGH